MERDLVGISVTSGEPAEVSLTVPPKSQIGHDRLHHVVPLGRSGAPHQRTEEHLVVSTKGHLGIGDQSSGVVQRGVCGKVIVGWNGRSFGV